MLLAGTQTATLYAAPQPTRRERQKPQMEPPSQVTHASASAKKDGFLPVTLIQDLQPGRLTQLLGQVVKLNTFNFEKTLLYLTDYTPNDSLMDIENRDDEGTEGDSFNYMSRSKSNWPGPWGQLTIQVTLWEPHATYAREELKPGSLVLLTYAHIKRRGDLLETAVHGDKLFPEKVHIREIPSDYDSRTQELMVRRKEYWKIHGSPKGDSDSKKKDKPEPRKKEPKQRETRLEEGQKLLPGPTLEPKLNKSGQCLS